MPRVLPVLALLLLLTPIAGAKKTKPTACPDGRFLLGDSAAGAMVLASGHVGLDLGCPATRAKVKARKKATIVNARWRTCDGVGRRVRFAARIAAPNCDTFTATLRVKGAKPRRFEGRRSACGDGTIDAGGGEGCDDGNQTGCDGCRADCAGPDLCVDGLDCIAYARPTPAIAPCGDVDASQPDVLNACLFGSGHLGTWAVDGAGLPAYEFAVDQRCDPVARAYSPRAYPLRDPIHLIGNGRGLMAMAHASGGVELYTQDRGHKWINRVDTWADPDDPTYPPQIGGGFSYWTSNGVVHSTRFDDLPVAGALARQTRRFGVGYVETVTHGDDGVVVRRRVFAPDSDARALVAEVTVENGSGEARDVGLVEFWDVNLHQASVELLTSDLLGPNTTPGIDRRRRAQAAGYVQAASWDPAARTALVTTTAKALPPTVTSRGDVADVDWFPEPIYLAVLDDGPAPDRVWLSDTELWPDGTRTPPAEATAAGDGAPGRTLALDGAGQHAVLALRVPVQLAAGASVTRRFAFGMVPGGGTPAADVASLRAAGEGLAAATDASWRERLVWAAFPGLEQAAAIQRELAWAAYSTIANASFDEYRQRRVVGQGGAYRFIHGLDGAMGDLALFAESILLLDPDLARDTLAYALSTQHATTQPIPGRFPYATTGVGNFSDVIIYDRRSDAYWFLPSIVGKYVGLTRDVDFLSVDVPYWPTASSETGPVLDHVERGLDLAEDEGFLGVGARGIVAIGTNDYADGVNNLAGEPVTPTGASSTYNAGMIVYGFPLAADVVEPLDPVLATRMRALVTSQTTALLDDAWEGHFFWRGFVDSGNPFAPQLFFLEPQLFPWLSGIVDDTRGNASLDQVAERLETPIGALSNVAIGDQGPVGGVDQPLIGGIWPVANAWLTAAYARRDAAEGWSSFIRNTLAAHAEAYPGLWYGIWTGPDSFNGPDKPRPGEADAHIATALTDYPALNAHMHTGPLRALTDLVGVAGTAAGIRIAPRVPTETFQVRWPRLRVQSTPTSMAGDVTFTGNAAATLTLALPSGLRSLPNVSATVNGVTTAPAVVDGEVELSLPASPGVAITWSVEAVG